MQNVHVFRDFLQKPRNAVILMHPKPDADALGSSLGLGAYLKKKGHLVTVISPTDYPAFLSWMGGNSDVMIYQPSTSKRIASIISQADAIFCLDFSNLSRINEIGKMVIESSAKKILIDHHLDPEPFADFMQWNSSAASTAELVYELVVELNDREIIDPSIAECLYAGLMTDTGSFRHGNTTHKVFIVAADLVALGANPSRISRLIYDTNSLERLRLMGFVLSKKLQVLPEFRTSYITLTKDELKEFDSQTGDTEGLVNYGLSIKDTVLSVLIQERKDNVKLSFRSLGNFSVNDFARDHFDGGGHRNAAGGQTNTTLEETLKKFLDLLPLYRNQLNS